MRIAALLLVLANIGYLVWHLWLQPPAGEPALVRSPSREAPQRLTLLSEVNGVADAGTPATSCLRVGEFADAAAAESFVARLEALGYRASIETLEVAGPPDFWVHMPPFASAAAARQQLEALQADNIDSYIIAGGELAQGISLGLFNQREAARRLQEQLASRGYQTSIREVPRSVSETWVAVAGLPPDGFTPGQWSALRQDRPGLQRREKAC